MHKKLCCYFVMILCLNAMPLHASSGIEKINCDDCHNWAILLSEKDKKYYIANCNPIKSEGTYTKRDTPCVVIEPSFDYESGIEYEFRALSGYKYHEDIGIDLIITVQNHDKKYPLFAVQESAWAYDLDHDDDIIRNIKKGKSLTVYGTSWKKTKSTDEFSAKGFTIAFNKIKALNKKMHATSSDKKGK